MNLRPEFESVRMALMNRGTSPDLDTFVQEVLQEQMRFQSQHTPIEETKAFLTPPSESDGTAFIAKEKPLQCFECKEYGHVTHNCKKNNFYNYCKRTGHLISKCMRCPPKRNEAPPRCPNQTQTALQAQVAPQPIEAPAS